MRFYDVALFIFLFNLAASMVIGLSLFDIQPYSPNQPLIDSFDVDSDTRLNQSLDQPPVNPESAIDLNYGNFLIGMGIFLSAFTYSTLGVFELMNHLLPGAAPIANMMAVIIYFIYAAGIIQLIFNRSFKVQQ